MIAVGKTGDDALRLLDFIDLPLLQLPLSAVLAGGGIATIMPPSILLFAKDVSLLVSAMIEC